MCEVIDNGKTRAINRGVDVAVFATKESSEAAMMASRVLVVMGICTSIVEVLTRELQDSETFLDYVDKTGALFFAE